VRRVVLAALVAALIVPAAALAASSGEIKHVSVGGFPRLGLTVVAPSSSQTAPKLTENGRAVAGLNARNLGASKSMVVAIDDSRSMLGQAILDAANGARSFVASKTPTDRVAVMAFGHEPAALTGFSTSTIDADTVLRQLDVDPIAGTALYEAVVQATSLLSSETNPARVLVLLTDGSNQAEGGATLDDAIHAAQDAGVVVYTIGIESTSFSPDPLQRLADATHGGYYGTASTAALADVYNSIAEDLQRTWQLDYVTAARPGDRLNLTLEFSTGGELTTKLTAPGEAPPAAAKPSPLLPAFFYTSDWGLPVLAGVIGLLALLATAFALAAPKGTWLRSRLDPHVASAKHSALKRQREERKFNAFAGLFKATEGVFGNLGQWKKLDRVLQRADFPLKAAEYAYIMFSAGLLFAFVGAAISPQLWFMAAAFAVGAFLPYAFASYKARKRLRAFDEQLPDMLVTMAASLKAGHSFRQGIQSVVDEGVDPAAKEFKRVLNETRLGRPMDDALNDMAARVGSKNFEFVMSAVTIQRQVGGSLAGLFDMVADTVRQRQQFHRKIRGLTAMGRMSAYVLIGLPFVVGFAIYGINREYMQPLLTTSTGHKLIVLMFVMMTIGSLMLKKIVSFKG
jgi:tight adherence protein B